MRRQNSTFNTAFVSHEGTQLNNNDYFGYVTLDKYACYVVADGLETWDEVNSAQVAVEAVIAAFTAHASMAKNALKRYIRTAHDSMRDNRSRLSMKASITVVVTDYVALRYAYVGNTRFNLFRSGFLFHESVDHSLSSTMAARHEIPMDKIAQHEQRGNLYKYLGQEGKLAPQISKKIALKDGDIVALFTRGVWESCDSYDMLAAFTDAGNYPMIACDLVERLILDPHPQEIDNYTLAVVFIDKVFTDPNKGKRRKLILKIAIPVALLLIILLVILLILGAQKREKRKNMQEHYLSGIEYIQDDNYVKAKEDMDEAYTLAEKLKDKAYKKDIDEYQRLIELVMNADALFDENKFTQAQEAYLTAQKRSKFTDDIALKYIENKLKLLGQFMDVQDMISRGNDYMDNNQFDLAQKEYQAAQNLSNRLNYQEGKDQASEALTAMQVKKKDWEDDLQKLADDEKEEAKKQQLKSEADTLASQADTKLNSGDLDGAKADYESAKKKYEEAEISEKATYMDAKLQQVEAKQKEKTNAIKTADDYVADGDMLCSQVDYVNAVKQYQRARDIYSTWNEKEKLARVEDKIRIANNHIANGDAP